MSDPRKLPLIDFDPREHGPRETARRKYGAFVEWTSENNLLTALGGIVLVFGLSYAAVEGLLPSVPNWLKVALVVSLLGAGSYVFVGMRSADALYRPESELLMILDSETGDLGIKRLAPERFENMSVESPNGKERSKDVLRRVRINGIPAYEVDRYDEINNVCITSWQAEASNREIRLHKNRLRDVKQDLEEEVDRSFELLINSSSIVREHSSEIANEIIHVAEKVETPTENSLTERLAERLEEAEPDDDLLGDSNTRTEISSEETSEETSENRNSDRPTLDLGVGGESDDSDPLGIKKND